MSDAGFVAGESKRNVRLVPEAPLVRLHHVQGFDDPRGARVVVHHRVAHHRPARARVRGGEDLAILGDPRPVRRGDADAGASSHRWQRRAVQGLVAHVRCLGACVRVSRVWGPLEGGVALRGRRAGRRWMRARLTGWSLTRAGHRGGAVRWRRGGGGRSTGWTRGAFGAVGRAAERERVGGRCGGSLAVGGVIPGRRARGSPRRVHIDSTPNATTTVELVKGRVGRDRGCASRIPRVHGRS